MQKRIYQAVYYDWLFSGPETGRAGLVLGIQLLTLLMHQDIKQAERILVYLFLTQLSVGPELRTRVQASLGHAFKATRDMHSLEAGIKDTPLDYPLKHWLSQLLREGSALDEEEYDPTASLDCEYDPAAPVQAYEEGIELELEQLERELHLEDGEGPFLDVDQEFAEHYGQPLVQFAQDPTA
jgi:hypothetical protein